MIVVLEIKRHSLWKAKVRVSFKKVIASNVLFMTLGAMIRAGIIIVLFRWDFF